MEVDTPDKAIAEQIEELRLEQRQMKVRKKQINKTAMNRWRSMELSGRCNYIQPDCDPYLRCCYAEATSFFPERQLVQWIETQTAEKGLAPSNAVAWLGIREPPFCRWTPPLAILLVNTAQRLPNERGTPGSIDSARWQIRRGTFKPGERLLLHTLRSKAHPLIVKPAFRLESDPLDTPLGEKRGPENGPRLWPSLTLFLDLGSQFPGLVFLALLYTFLRVGVPISGPSEYCIGWDPMGVKPG